MRFCSLVSAAAHALIFISFPATTQGDSFFTATAQAFGTCWTNAIWTNTTVTTPVPPASGNTYECVANGNPIANNTLATHVRTPVTNSSALINFPGNSLTLDTNTILWCKRIAQPGSLDPVLNFPGVGGNPGLVINGGLLYTGDASTIFTITGAVRVGGVAYLSPNGGSNPGGPTAAGRSFNIAGRLSGNGTIILFQGVTNTAQEISGNANTFSGQWIVKAGWLVGSASNSLGAANITLNPQFSLGLDPSILDVPGPALLEVNYDINSSGVLTLTNGGMMRLHQNCVFSGVRIESSLLSQGTHSYAELNANFPANFPAGGSGTITAQPAGPVAPTIFTQPASQTVLTGQTAIFQVAANGSQPLAYQWRASATNSGAFTNLSDGGQILGAMTANLSISNVNTNNTADFLVIVTNSLGAVTSSVARLTVTLPTPPTIIIQPTNQTLNSGQTVNFTIIASGTPPLSYQWRAGAINSSVVSNLFDGGQISGATTTNLSISNVITNNTCDLVVVVTNTAGGTTSSVARLTVLPPPPSNNSIESMLLRLDFYTNPFSFRVTEKGTSIVLLLQSANQFTFGGSAYTVSVASNIVTTANSLEADLGFSGTSSGAHVKFAFSQPAILQVSLSSTGNPTQILQQFADQGEDMFGALEVPFGATLSARGYSWALRGGNGVSGIDQACGAHAPFYLTTRHYGIYVESQGNGTMTFAQGGHTSFSFPVSQLTYNIIYGTDYAAIMAGFNSRTVPAFVPPLWALDSAWWSDDDHAGFHGSVTNAQGNVLDRAIQLTNYQIHASAITVDRPYGTSCTQFAGPGGWGNMDFDNSNKGFNDPVGMINSLHSMGYNMMIWIADECWCGLRAAATNNGWAFYPTNNNTTVDLSNTNAYHWFKTNLDVYVNMGVMGYKIDRGDEGEMPDSVQNVNDNLFAQLSMKGLNAVYPSNWFMYTRSISDTGRQYTAIWNGDTTSLFSGLQSSVIAGLRAGILNFPMWGSDTGGYLIGPKQPTEELFDRWLEFSAWCPMMEVLVGGSRTPWYDYSTNFNNPTNVVAIAAASAGTHHDLIPCTRSLLYQATQTGMPVMRPIMFGYPNDTNNSATITNCEYLFGPSLLVAPVVTSNATTRNVYLPPDSWLDYNNRSNQYSGPVNVIVPAPIQAIPVFVNQGAIIPRGDIWLGNNNWTPNWSPRLRIEFFPAEIGGSSFDYFTGTSTQSITCSNRSHTLTIQFGDLGFAGNLDIYLRSPGSVVRNGVKLTPGTDYSYDPTQNFLRTSFTGPTTLVVSNAGSLFSPLEAWRTAQFGNPNDPALSADAADPDGDGIPNFLEYAFDLDPLQASSSGSPAPSIVSDSGDSYLAMTFRRATNATDLTYTAMVADDLVHWLAGSTYSAVGSVPVTTNTTEISRSLSNTVEIITVRDNVPIRSATQRFMQLRVTMP